MWVMLRVDSFSSLRNHPQKAPVTRLQFLYMYEVFYVMLLEWICLNTATINNMQSINAVSRLKKQTQRQRESHLLALWEQDVLCVGLNTFLIIKSTSGALTFWWKSDAFDKRQLWKILKISVTFLRAEFFGFLLITMEPDYSIPNGCMRSLLGSHASAANPTMTTTWRQEASACTVDALLTQLPKFSPALFLKSNLSDYCNK